MEKLIIQIEASSDFFDGFAINCEGVSGAGQNVAACKENVLEGLRLLKESRPMEQCFEPEETIVPASQEIVKESMDKIKLILNKPRYGLS